jgi:hypothetical protein
VSLVGIGLVAAGVLLFLVGYRRALGPWRRYQALREQDANIRRYEAWRGGIRDSGPTGASVAMAVLRRQAQREGAIALVGFCLVVAGFLAK